MTPNILLSLDLSTTCTGWAKWDIKRKRLLSYGKLKPLVKNPKKKGVPLLEYPFIQLLKMQDLSEQIKTLITDDISHIVIEEVNQGKNRIGQKVLNGLHWILLERLKSGDLKKVSFCDSDGKVGWRSGLKLVLSDADKLYNKSVKKLNKDIKGKKVQKITLKTLSCRFANREFGLDLNAERDIADADMADAINLGYHIIVRFLYDNRD